MTANTHILSLSLFIGHSLGFATAVFRTILSEQSIDQLGKYLVLSGVDTRLLELFPPNKREEECLARHFEAEDMKQLVGFHQRNQKNSMKGDLLSNLKGLLGSEASVADVSVHMCVMMIGIYLLFQILGPCSYQGSKEGSWSGRS
jgi:hypothetical protein